MAEKENVEKKKPQQTARGTRLPRSYHLCSYIIYIFKNPKRNSQSKEGRQGYYWILDWANKYKKDFM